jgi:hypothetical protein
MVAPVVLREDEAVSADPETTTGACDDRGLAFDASPMHELAAHPDAARLGAGPCLSPCPPPACRWRSARTAQGAQGRRRHRDRQPLGRLPRRRRGSGPRPGACPRYPCGVGPLPVGWIANDGPGAVRQAATRTSSTHLAAPLQRPPRARRPGTPRAGPPPARQGQPRKRPTAARPHPDNRRATRPRRTAAAATGCSCTWARASGCR